MDKIGDRMKTYYETPAKTSLTRRVPVIIRVDGKAFHSFTKKFEKPFDRALQNAMYETMLALCKNIQGCKFAYTQSDEISLLLTDYDNINTSAWFDYEVQKMCSVTASMATQYFNRSFAAEINKEGGKLGEYQQAYMDFEHKQKVWLAHQAAFEKGALFDSRCFNVPKEDVCNYFYWRELDAVRNSIQMVAHTEFKQKELLHKANSEVLEMLKKERHIDWTQLPVSCQRGVCAYKGIERGWVLDEAIPIFSQDWDYIARFV